MSFDWIGDSNITLNVFSGNFLDPGEDQMFVGSFSGDGGHAILSLPSGANTYFTLRLEGPFSNETFLRKYSCYDLEMMPVAVLVVPTPFTA